MPTEGFQVQIYDSAWGGFRWYDGLTEQETYSEAEAVEIVEQARELNPSRLFRVMDLAAGRMVDTRTPKPGAREIPLRRRIPPLIELPEKRTLIEFED